MNIIIVIFQLFIITLVNCQTCYWPDGKSIAASYQPCNTTTAQCCYNSDPRHRDFCFDNGLCMSRLRGYVYRGACSDPKWSPESGCARHCTDVDQDTHSPVTACGMKMCCGSVFDPAVVACCRSKNTDPDSDVDGFWWSNSTLSNLETCPKADQGLARSDIIAIIIGSAAVFVALIAWIWPQKEKPQTPIGRLRKSLGNIVSRR
ncbi:hypothetical protein V8F20_011579 [Naviculisporaceae sp. PSN 640]